MQTPGSDPWPPLTIGAMIADMEQNIASMHWAHTRRYVQSWAARLVPPDLGYRFDPDDLTQNVMFILMRPGKLSTFRRVASTTAPDVVPPRAFRKFLKRMTSLTFKDMLRSARTEAKRRHKHHFDGDTDPPDELDPLDQLASREPTTEDQLVIAEDLAEVMGFLAALRADNASAARNVAELLRSVFTDDDYQRIAEQFARDPNAVRGDIFRIRDKVRQAFSHLTESAKDKSKRIAKKTTGKTTTQPPASRKKTPSPRSARQPRKTSAPPKATGQPRRAQPPTTPAIEKPLQRSIETTLPSSLVDADGQLPASISATNHRAPEPSPNEKTSMAHQAQQRKGQGTP